ncbi:MAG: hypothetical protein ACJ76Y_07925 [Thermoanaerobaculia bacterium]
MEDQLMEIPTETRVGSYLSEKEAKRYFRLREAFFEFVRLFDYSEASDRAVAVVGPAYLDTLLYETLVSFFIDEESEVNKLLRPDGSLGKFGSRVTACYCLGLIGDIVKKDLQLVGKIRNRFAHDLSAQFSDPQISSYCRALRWHRELLPDPPPGATDRDLFQVGVNQLVCHLEVLPSIARFDKRVKKEYC